MNEVGASTGGGIQETVHQSFPAAGVYYIRLDRQSDEADYDVSLQVW